MRRTQLSFEELKTFIQRDMRMTEVYQPLVIKTLLQHDGQAPVRQLALAALPYDQAQVDYYEQIMKRWPKITLTKHEIVTYIRGGTFVLNLSVPKLSPEQKSELIELCNQKIDEFLYAKLSRADGSITKTPSHISGLVRYRVLARAKGRCALCGIHKDERPLDVDHIVPLSRGGTNSIDNLQALCYVCNRAKRDLDQTDFRRIGELIPVANCPLCYVPKTQIAAENPLAIAVVADDTSSGCHSLIVPRRHAETYFDLTHPEISALNRLLFGQRQTLQQESSHTRCRVHIDDSLIPGYQVSHAHIRLIVQ